MLSLVLVDGGFRPQKGYHTELRRNADESFDFFTKGRIRYHYFLDPQKFDVKLFAEFIPLEFIEDPNGNKLRMVYDTDSRLIEVVEEDSSGARGRSLYFDYVEVFAEWRLSKVRGPLGLVVDYLYDETTANLVEVRRDERIERYVYQGPEHFDRHNMTARIGPNGARTEYEYFEGDDPFPNEEAGAGLLPALKVEYVKAVKELSRAVVTTFSYDLSELEDRRLTTTVTDARANQTTYVLNGNGSPLRIEEPAVNGPVVTEMEWAVDDIFKLREVDANGRVTRFEYDDNANLTKEIIETGSLGEVVTEFAYDPFFNKMTRKVDAEGRATSFEIDATTGNLSSTTDAEGNATTFTYDASNGDLVSTRGPRPSQATTFTYDAFGNPETTTDALGNTTIADYDERSRLLSSTDTFGRSMVQRFDGLDRVTRVERTDALGSSDPEVVLREYHAGGQVHRQTNGLGVTTTIVLDGMNRVIETNATVNGETLTTAAVYDGNSNVLSRTDRRGVATLNTYDALNRLTELEVGGQTVATMEYDAVGNKLAETDLQGNRTAFAYDDLYRVSARTLPTGHVEGFTYDRVGNKLAENDANGHETTFQYDALNRLVRRLDAESNEVTLAYDEAGNAVQEKDITRGLETMMAYDALNRPIVRTVSGSSFSYTTSFDYRDSRHEIVETDGRGFQRTTALDGFDRVHRVVQQTGEAELVTTNFYDANGNLSSTKDPEGRETVFVYDGLNRLLEIQHPLSLTTRFLYDGEGNKTEETNRRGIRTRFTYDHLSRLTESATDPQITGNPVTTTIQYDDAARTRTELDARGNATTFVMDGQGRVVTITDADNNAQSFEYDGVNKLAEVDKRGQRTSFEYDGINRLVTMTDALSQKIETAYRDAALQIVETDKRGLVRRTQLDALGRLVSVTRSNVTLEQHAYDPNNNRILSTDANGNQTQFTYDGANRLTARTDGFGSADATTTRFTYDGVGNLLEEKDGRATGKAFDIHNTYDALNRLTSVQDGAGQVTSFEYDGEGNRTAQTEPKGNRTEFSYGELSELIEVRMADSGVYRYTYDPNRNRTQQTDANGNVVAFTYDALNRVARMEQQGAGLLVTLHTYDPNGNEITLTDPKGQVIGFEYDELNRLTNKTYSLTADDFALFTRTHSIGFSYDPNDNLVRIDELKSTGTDPAAVVSSFKTYDTLDRLTSETDAFGRTLGFAYDSQGNRTRLVDPDAKQTTYSYDALNRLQTLTFDDGKSTRYEYFPDGLKKRVTNPNNTNSTYEYDGADRMTDIVHLGPVGVVSSYFYAYDANGNRKRQIETNAGRTEETTYDYDAANRLAMVTYALGTADATQVTYTYDPVGNRLSEREIQLSTSTATKDLAYVYDAINRLDAITDNLGAGADVVYTYDSNGNTTQKTKNGTTTSFLYDIRDQLGEVQQGANVLGRYGFDYQGRRTLKIGDDGRRHYTYDQLSTITEADEIGKTISKYDYGLDQLLSLDNTVEGRSFFHLDFLGSTANLTDGFGGTRQSILYDAWGNERDRVGLSSNKFTFTGHELDEETGLIYAKSRFYDPDIGRFLTQDSFLGDASNAPSLHRYQYAHSRPTFWRDPTGHAPGDFWDPRSYDWGVALDEAASIANPLNYDWATFASDIKENAVTRLVGVGGAAVDAGVSLATETFYMAGDTVNLALGRDVPLASQLTHSTAARMQQGESTGSIITGSAIDIGANVVTVGMYGTAKEYGSIITDAVAGRASIEDVEQRLQRVAGQSVTECGPGRRGFETSGTGFHGPAASLAEAESGRRAHLAASCACTGCGGSPSPASEGCSRTRKRVAQAACVCL